MGVHNNYGVAKETFFTHAGMAYLSVSTRLHSKLSLEMCAATGHRPFSLYVPIKLPTEFTE